MGNQPSSPSSPPRSPEDILQEQVCGPDCQKQKDLATAFQAFQAATKNKDADPETYAWAKFQYMSLKNGPEWAAQEKQRLVKTQIDPILTKYQQEFVASEGEIAAQRQLVDVVESVEAKQSQMKAAFEAQMKALDESVSEKRDKVGVWNRLLTFSQDPETPTAVTTTNKLVAYFGDYPQSFVTILDVFIAVIAFFILSIVWRKSRVQAEAIRRAGFLPFFGQAGAAPATQTVAAPVAAAVAAGPGFVARAGGFLKDYFPFFFVLLATAGIVVAIVYATPKE
jgi:hypothetical protein